MGRIRMIIKPAKWNTSRPMWGDENADVVETAMIDPEVAGAEYRETDGADPQGMRAAGQQGSRAAGHDPMGRNNNPEGAEEK